MKIFALLLVSLLMPGVKKANSEIVATARSAIVMERHTKSILYAHNIDLARTVASISKIMTAVIAIENEDVSKIVIVPEEIKKAVGSMIYVSVGDQISLIDLLYGLMLRSGNDAAVTIAVSISGTLDDFVALMNEKAEALNMSNSFFRNPHGLDEFDGGNISTARDMALLMAYAMDNPIFRQIVATKNYRATSIGMTWQNKNRLLGMYSLAIGGKTGYTKKAKRTLVSCSKFNDTELVVVTLDCGSDFAYHKNLSEKYFSTYQARLLLPRGQYQYDKYLIEVSRDYYFLSDINFWKKAIFSIEIDEKAMKAELAIYASERRYSLGEEDIIEIKEKKKVSWWQRVINFFKGLFS